MSSIPRLLAGLSLLLAVVLPQVAASKVGETLEQSMARYGEEQPLERTDTALFKKSRLHAFSSDGLRVVVEILGGKVVATTFSCEKSHAAKRAPSMQRELIEKLVKVNGDGVGWRRIAGSTTVSHWARRDGKMSAVYDPLDYHLVLYSTEVDDSVVEDSIAKPVPTPVPVTRLTEDPSSPPAPISLPDTLTIGGDAYKNPVYRSHNEFLLNITHETGAASVLIANLSSSLQAKLGFDRQAAASAQAAFAELQAQAAKQHAENQVRKTESREALTNAAQTTSEQAPPQGLDLSHSSLRGGPALEPDAIAANLFDLKGQIVRVSFRTSDHRAVTQTTGGFYELNVLPNGCNAVVRVPVEIGRKWFGPKNTKYYPRRFIVRVDVGKLENTYGSVRDGAILVAIGTKVRHGIGSEGSRVEW
jgi:hypothetical protein